MPRKVEKKHARMGKRRQAVLQWILSGEPGTHAELARSIRRQGIDAHATTSQVSKDVYLIRGRWREDEQYRWAKEEYRARLQELYYRAHTEARRSDATSRERTAAIEECRKLLQQIGQMDGFWTREQVDTAESMIATLEVTELRKALKDEQSAVINTTVELIE